MGKKDKKVVELKVYPCLYSPNVECTRARANFNRCAGCPEFGKSKFEREMDAEDEAADREAEMVFKYFPVK